MEQYDFHYPADQPASQRAIAGVVGSGDLEVLLEPGLQGRTQVRVTTSVHGFAAVWKAQLDRLFGGSLVDAAGPAVNIEINDFGATPGVVGMRIAQAFEAAGHVRGGPRA